MMDVFKIFLFDLNTISGNRNREIQRFSNRHGVGTRIKL